MKRKELKQIAAKIIKLEQIIQNSNDAAKSKQAQLEIMELSSHVGNLNDMIIIDELVQKMLESS